MRFSKAVKPYIEDKLKLSRIEGESGNFQKQFELLEDVHVLGQQSTYYHTLVHFNMLRFGIEHADFREILGQIVRLVGALTKTAIGLVPIGNTGGANVSPFKNMAISPENQEILEKVKHAQA